MTFFNLIKDIDVSFTQGVIVFILVIIPLLYELCPSFRYQMKMGLVYGWYLIQGTICAPYLLFKWRNVSNILFMANILRPLGSLLGIKYQIVGKEILESNEPCIYICNHQSSLDIIGMSYVWPFIKRCTVVAKKEILYLGTFGFMAWLCGTVFINRLKSEEARNLLNKQIAELKKNKIKLWIFPEGTRNHTSSLLPFKKGAFHLAVQAQIPIVPIIFSSYSSFYDKNKWKFLSGGKVFIKVLPPVCTKGITQADISKLADVVRNNMIEAFNETSEETLGSYENHQNTNGI